jgi:DNA-binding transcriptional ArsR family regulator
MSSADLLGRVCAEIDARMRELHPAVLEYERLLDAADSAAADQARATSSSARAARRGAPATGAAAATAGAAARSPVGVAIIAALEHGSHTVSELVVVTAMSPARVREGLRRLASAGTVNKAQREGKAAYALSSPAG